ncbi:LysR family transcriptional regulator [Mycolicibacterium sediminis]|uniref:Probable hydrogen peroxide-inducible genes activator n=1 Tax=Mycolicibacterium sediminis TaxID=1286180 RepID=A0A7I7QSV7_9MYCO|nr:LysR substrate-binding domain-containing protein [Mycolicibacterium sediminis]BBY29384.1 LysR family transcriptional regulator [Mycolicibacterium sediminis]
MGHAPRLDELTLAGLRVCREIALLGSFTAAARSLGYSQPAISRQVAAMEAAAGAPLFVRETRGVRLSAAGTTVVGHAARIMADVESLGRDLEGLADQLTGTLRMGVFPSAAAVLAPRAIAHLGADHPGLSVTLSEGSTPALLRDLRRDRLAVAVIGTGSGLPHYDLDGLTTRRISTADLCVAVWADHRFAEHARTTPVPVGELATERWVVGDGAAGDPQFEAWPTLREPVIAHRAKGWPSRLGMVAAGLGVCVLPELAAASVPAGVVTVLVDDPGWLGRVTLAVTRPEPSAEVRAVLDALATVADGLDAARATAPRRRSRP